MEMARLLDGDKYFDPGAAAPCGTPIAYDPSLNLVYFGTGNGVEWNRVARGEARSATNLFLAPFVAVMPIRRVRLGTTRSAGRHVGLRTPTESIVLADLPVGGKMRKCAAPGAEERLLLLLDRATGELLSAEKYTIATWGDQGELKTGMPQIDDAASDWTTGPKLVMPGPLGGHKWQPMSYSPRHRPGLHPGAGSRRPLAPDNDAVFDPRTGVWNLGTQPLALPEDPSSCSRDRLLQGPPGGLGPGDAEAGLVAGIQDAVERRHPQHRRQTSSSRAPPDGRFVAYAADSGRKLWKTPATAASWPAR